MDFLKPVIDFDRFVRGLLFLAVITVLVLGLRWLSPVLIPFFCGWAIAWILAPVVNFFQNTCRLRSRVLSVLITLALLIGLASAVAWLIIPPPHRRGDTNQRGLVELSGFGTHPQHSFAGMAGSFDAAMARPGKDSIDAAQRQSHENHS